ncbi:MAG: hypothetical protein R3349_05345 [Geminicoccaceae bacterium]|nr:hypothetical protein [Geminicoccaceae bacterium]
MTYLAIALAIAIFCWSLHAFRLVPASLEAVSTARQAAGVMRDPALDDDEKESRVQAAALRLFKLFGTITLRVVAALLLPAVAVVLLAWAGVVDLDAVLEAAISWPVIIVSTVVMVAVLVVWR